MLSNSNLVGKKEYVEWINKILKLNYLKVEDFSNGAAFCQVMDLLYPGTVPMGRVNFSADLPHQKFENYKVLQESFTKNGITKLLDVDALSKGKITIVLELLQWIYQQYIQIQPKYDYDPLSRRNSTKNKEVSKKIPKSSLKTISKPQTAKNTSQQATNLINQNNLKTVVTQSQTKPSTANKISQPESIPPKSNSGIDPVAKQKIKLLKNQVTEITEKYEEMQQERDFYYDKLRRVEDFCQDYEENNLIKQVLSILYQTDENLGFVTPEEEE